MLWLMGSLEFRSSDAQVHGLTLTTASGRMAHWPHSNLVVRVGRYFSRRSFRCSQSLGLVLGTMGAIVVITRGELSSRVLALPTTRGDYLYWRAR